MNETDKLCQLVGAEAALGTFGQTDGTRIEFVALTLRYLHAGSSHTAPEIVMSADHARSLALQLLAVADKATGTGTPPGAVPH